MYWHIDTDIISFIVITAIYICNLNLSKMAEDSVRDKRFLRCLEIGMVVTVIDIISSIAMEMQVSRLIYHLLMTLYFMSIELVILEWFCYVLVILYPHGERIRRGIKHLAVTIYVIYAVFAGTNPWTGVIYKLGPNNEYTRGPLFSMMIVLFAAYILILFYIILRRRKFIPKDYPQKVLLITPAIIAVGIAVQLSMPGWLFILPSYMLCLLLAFLFFQTIRVKSDEQQMNILSNVAKSDPLTGLFNRAGMETMVKRALNDAVGKPVVVMLADIDDLKHINDSMGHAEGDRAIILVAHRLKRHFGTSDTVVRYGGDEFLAFKVGIAENDVEDFISRLTDNLKELSVGEKDNIPVHGSIGAAFGIIGKDTFESLCEKADNALYYVKRNGKNGFAIYEKGMKKEGAVI